MFREKAIRLIINKPCRILNSTQVYDAIGKELLIDEYSIQQKIAELQAEYDANQYQRDRQPEYPSIQDQLDMQFWDKVNGTNNWQEAIEAVKTKHPKPE
jgi:hypothetical protein